MEERIVKDTFRKFFWPTLAASVTLSVLSMSDLVIAGWFVGELGLSAISLALPVTMFIQIASALFGMGGAIAASASLGRGELEESSRIFTLSLLGALAAGVAAALAGSLFLEPLIRLLGGRPGAVMEEAKAYIGTLILGLPAMILSPVMITFLRNDSQQSYSMVCVVACSLFNIAFSAGFSAVLGLGIFGIGLATVLSQLLCCVLAGARLFRPNRMFRLVRFRPDGALCRQMLFPGLPVASIFLSQAVLTVVINRILAQEGAGQGVAVYAVIKYLINFMFALFDGVTGAIQPMLGIYYGEREQENIRYTVNNSFRAMLAMALFMFGVMMLGGGPLCRLFGVESGELSAMTAGALRIEAICCLTSALITYVNAFYRCTGNARISVLMSIGDNLIFPVGCVLLCSRVLGMGIWGVWWGLVAGGLCTLCLWALYCLIRGRGFLLLDEGQFARPEHELHLICPARREELGSLMGRVEAFCSEMNISPKKKYYISLTIEELAVNVVGMADQAGACYVDVRISPNEKGEVWLRIRDNLTEFNPAQLATDNMRELALKSGGSAVNELGIGIVKKIARDYSYKRTIGFNNFSVLIP